MPTNDKKEAARASAIEQAQKLQRQLLRGQLTREAYESELRKLGISQHASEPQLSASLMRGELSLGSPRKIQTTPPVSAEHLRFAQSHESMPQTGTSHAQYIAPQGTQLAQPDIDSLSFDDLPVEPPQHTGSQRQTHPPLGKHTPGSRQSLEQPQPLLPKEPSTWRSGTILDQRFQIEGVLSELSDEVTFGALDLFLQEQVIIHLAMPVIAKTPGYRLGFAKRYLPLRDFLHPQVCRLYHIEYRHDEGLLYAVALYHSGTTLQAQLRRSESPRLSAAGGESLLGQLASVLKQYRSHTGQHAAPQLADIMWDIANPQDRVMMLRLRPPGPDLLKSPSCEVFAVATLLRSLLAGTDRTMAEPLSQLNPTVSLRLDAVLQQAAASPEQGSFGSVEALYTAYRQALLPRQPAQGSPEPQTQPPQSPRRTPPPRHEPQPQRQEPSTSERPTDERLQTLMPSHTIHAHVADLLSLSTDASGMLCLTTGKDQQLKWWETGVWRLTYAETVAKSSLNHARISPCGRLVAYCKSSHRVAIARAGDFNSLCTLQHSSPVLSLMWHPSGAGLLAMTRDNQIHHWRIPSGQIIKSMIQPDSLTDLIAQARLNPDQRLLTTLHKRGKIRFWSLDAHKWLFDLPDAVSPASSITYPTGSALGNDSLLLTGHHDGKLRMWDYQTGVLHHKASAHDDQIVSLETSPDGRHVASLDASNELRLWQLMPDLQLDPICKLVLPQPSTRQGQQHALQSCMFVAHNDTNQLIGRSKSATFYVWDVPTEDPPAQVERQTDTQRD